MSDRYNDPDWTHQVESNQRSTTTEATITRRHGQCSTPQPSDGDEPNDDHSSKGGEDGFDGHGIPTGI